MNETTRRILLLGAVQGCGLRPALARLAAQHKWSGSVRNGTAGVELILRGRFPSEESLRLLISSALPPSASVQQFVCEPLIECVAEGFHILESATLGPVTAQIPRDQAICRHCLQESRDPQNRRYRYPFITCAVCGPRYSILESVPFDRERTTMTVFAMCPECRREYHDPLDRRFHAQTISCPQCGPHLWASDAQGTIVERNKGAWELAAGRLRRGEIVALRGVGGYQLLVDATSSEAVSRLRCRKQRPAKPLAVLCRTLAEACALAHLSIEEETQLCSSANPIVLVRQRSPSSLAPELNAGLAEIGLLLPTTALHDLLLEQAGRPLVCTSGNREGEPLAYRIDVSQHRLQEIADWFLHHDREIQRPIDDSVVRVMARRPVTMRAARGIAPLPLTFSATWLPDCEKVKFLACGGHQKSAIALANNASAMLGPHWGDLDSLAVQARWIDQIDGPFGRLACDPHPGYFPTQWAGETADAPLQVWHHHAHVVSGMWEHGWLDREVLGVAWDGTGLGPDGTLWGGEFLRATATQFQRVAHLRPFVLPGGEAAISDLRRITVAMLSQLDEFSPNDLVAILDLQETDVRRIQQILKSPFSPTTTSCGRLFDAAACLILNQSHATFEGQAAMHLEAACDSHAAGAYRLEILPRQPVELDWRPMLRQILADRRAGVSRGIMAMRFHRGLAQAIIEVAKMFPELPVVLGGGVFQNRVLVELVAELWPACGPELGLPGMIPPNDGGLAAGQLAVAMASMMHKETNHVSGSSRSACRVDQPRPVAGHRGY